MTKTLLKFLAAATLAMTASAGVVCAQQTDQSQGQQQSPPANQGTSQSQGPIPAYRSPLAGVGGDEDDQTTSDLAPDTRPVTGAQNFSLGIPIAHSYWQPHVDFTSTIDSNPNEFTGTAENHDDWGTWISLSGGVDVHRATPSNDLELNYIGGGSFASNIDASNGVVQELSISDKQVFRRWDLLVLDNASYLPESPFGFNGLGAGAGGLPGGGIITPGQTLLTGRGQNLSNEVESEVDVFLTGRASLTFVGGYSILQYFDESLLNDGSANFRVGYNYLLNRKDTLGLDYTFIEYSYSGFNQSITSHAARVSYGRKITGRLAFQFAAGPQINLFHTAIAQNSTTPTIGSTTEVGWTLNTALQYQLKRTNFTLQYDHGLTAGSGIQAGSITDTASGSINHAVSRSLSAGIVGGYSRNSGLTVEDTETIANQVLDYWYGGGNLGYRINRTVSLNLSYQLQYQNSGAAFCVSGTCGTNIVRHMISFGIGWRERPLLF